MSEVPCLMSEVPCLMSEVPCLMGEVPSSAGRKSSGGLSGAKRGIWVEAGPSAPKSAKEVNTIRAVFGRLGLNNLEI